MSGVWQLAAVILVLAGLEALGMCRVAMREDRWQEERDRKANPNAVKAR